MTNVTDTLEKAKIEFENSLKQRNFEIDLFWKRSWFFGALILASIAGYYQLKSQNAPILPPIFLAFLTTVITLLQCLMNRGSKFWQERWEYMTSNREAALGIELTKLKKYTDPDKGEWYYIDASILSKGENILTRSRRFSVSKLTFLVWDIIFITSALCWINDSCQLFTANPNWKFTFQILLFHSIISLYIYFFIKKGHVYEAYKIKEDISILKKLNEDYINNKVI